jgi:hypothetical protein
MVGVEGGGDLVEQQQEGGGKEQRKQHQVEDAEGRVQYVPGVQSPAAYQMQAAVRRDVVKFGSGSSRPLLALKPLRTGRVH